METRKVTSMGIHPVGLSLSKSSFLELENRNVVSSMGGFVFPGREQVNLCSIPPG